MCGGDRQQAVVSLCMSTSSCHHDGSTCSHGTVGHVCQVSIAKATIASTPENGKHSACIATHLQVGLHHIL